MTTKTKGALLTQDIVVAAIALWDTRRFRTDEIASALFIREADVERIIHIRRQAARGIA
jgi:hypothetical protein